MHFNDGSTYRNIGDLEELEDTRDIYVLGVDEVTRSGVWLAVLFINREDINDTEPGEIFINKDCFKDWMELDEEESYV